MVRATKGEKEITNHVMSLINLVHGGPDPKVTMITCLIAMIKIVVFKQLALWV